MNMPYSPLSLCASVCLLSTSLILAVSATAEEAVAPAKVEAGFVSLFDGKTLEGWKKSDENQDAWQVKAAICSMKASKCR